MLQPSEVKKIIWNNMVVNSVAGSPVHLPTQISSDCEITINGGYWTGCPHYEPRRKVKSLEFYEDVIRRVIVCELVMSDKHVVGIARCHPKDDYFDVIGRKIALTKAISSMKKGTREIVWNYYFKHFQPVGIIREDK